MRTEHAYKKHLPVDQLPKPAMDPEKRRQYRFKGRSNKVGDINNPVPQWVDYK